ncbi:MAG TPA: hypothetical protein VKE91_19100, partial [Blastocatellia bacterium]|nr:hypothetical protein [Blastocatellia bacterium]
LFTSRPLRLIICLNTQGAKRPRSMPHSSPHSPSQPPAVAPGPDHRQEDRHDTFARDYAEQIETIARTQYAHLNRITAPHGQNFPASVSSFPPPKGPAQRS